MPTLSALGLAYLTLASTIAACVGAITLARQHAAKKAIAETLAAAARHDTLTGLPNRSGLDEPTIAQVQGKCIAGGLMLVWPCDLIVAAEDTAFMDNTLPLAVCGAEFFNHPWELGVRKAKEMLFTADWVSAQDGLSSWHGQSCRAAGAA